MSDRHLYVFINKQKASLCTRYWNDTPANVAMQSLCLECVDVIMTSPSDKQPTRTGKQTDCMRINIIIFANGATLSHNIILQRNTNTSTHFRIIFSQSSSIYVYSTRSIFYNVVCRIPVYMFLYVQCTDELLYAICLSVCTCSRRPVHIVDNICRRCRRCCRRCRRRIPSYNSAFNLSIRPYT